MKLLKFFEMNNLPIRYKLIVHFLLISILPSIGLGFLISWTVERIIEEQASNHTLQLIEKVNQSLDSYVNNLQNISYLVTFNPEMQMFLDEEGQPSSPPEWDDLELKKFLQGFTTVHPEVAGMLIVNRSGDYVSNELYARTKKQLTEEDWYHKAVDHRGIFTIIGHPERRNITSHVNYQDHEVVSVVRAMLDPATQRVKGVILIDLKLRVIAEAVKDVRLGKTGYLMVLDDQGRNIYSPANQLIEHIPEVWKLQQSSGVASAMNHGNKLQFIYKKSPLTNWTTMGVFSTQESVPEVREIRFYVISFVFIVCLLGIAASL